MNTLTPTIEKKFNTTLNSLIKANSWIFEQINKSVPESLTQIKVLNKGTEGSQFYADQQITVTSPSGEKDEENNLILTTSLDIENDKFNVFLYREDDFSEVTIPHKPKLTKSIEDAFVKAGLLTH
ncbi:MAG: hypothetical protein ACI87J_001972 [Colwellia sp.]|jgi:hypothetical protein